MIPQLPHSLGEVAERRLAGTVGGTINFGCSPSCVVGVWLHSPALW